MTKQCFLCISTEILGEGSSDSGAESSDEEDEEDSEGDYIIVLGICTLCMDGQYFYDVI